MKNILNLSARATAVAVALAGISSASAAGFFDDFESGLIPGRWTGKDGGWTSAEVVADPLNTGRGNVLTFCDISWGGDIFTAEPLNCSSLLQISFDYLGQPGTPCATPGDLGGFMGISSTLSPMVNGQDHTWLAGTQEANPTLLAHLTDDGQWRRYDMVVDGAALGAFRMMFQDYAGSGGSYGDIYFDNISVTCIPTPVPEPTVATLAILGALAVARLGRRQA